MARVLIGFAEALPAPEVLFSLREAGHSVSLFARRRGLPIERLPVERTHVVPDPSQSASAAVAALREAIKADPPDIILPLDDAGLWLVETAFPSDPRSAGAQGAQAAFALDKELQIAAAVRAGLDVPETLVVRSREELDRPIPLPAIFKPAQAVQVEDDRLLKGATKYLLDPANVSALKASLPDTFPPHLVQPLVPGVGEGVFGFAGPEGITGWSGHRRLRMMNPHGSGSSACRSVMPSEELRERIGRFLADAGWQGPFMVELLRSDDGTAWFMELNGRMWGSMALARRQGLEYPAWAVARALDPRSPLPTPKPPHGPMVERDLGRDLLHLLFVLKGPRTPFHRQTWPAFWRSLGGVLAPAHPRAFYNYDPKHPSFFLRQAAWTVLRALKP